MTRRQKRDSAGLAFVLFFTVVGAAHAQHVVTEAEASKLTLEALTAPPPPPRPIYRAYVHRAIARSYATRETRWVSRFSDRRDGWMVRHGGIRVSERRVLRRSSHTVSGRHHRT